MPRECPKSAPRPLSLQASQHLSIQVDSAGAANRNNCLKLLYTVSVPLVLPEMGAMVFLPFVGAPWPFQGSPWFACVFVLMVPDGFP